MQPNGTADLPRQQRVPIGGIAPDEQNRRRGSDLGHAGGFSSEFRESTEECGEIGGPPMIDVVGVEYGSGEFLENVILLVGGKIRTDHAGRAGPLSCFLQQPCRLSQRLIPGCRTQFSVDPHQRGC